MAIVDHVAADLRAEFPSMKGFSRSNVMSMRAFAAAWSDPEFVQQPVGQVPLGYDLVLLTKMKDRDERWLCAGAFESADAVCTFFAVKVASLPDGRAGLGQAR
jgi:hypothetical protein